MLAFAPDGQPSSQSIVSGALRRAHHVNKGYLRSGVRRHRARTSTSLGNLARDRAQDDPRSPRSFFQGSPLFGHSLQRVLTQLKALLHSIPFWAFSLAPTVKPASQRTTTSSRSTLALQLITVSKDRSQQRVLHPNAASAGRIHVSNLRMEMRFSAVCVSIGSIGAVSMTNELDNIAQRNSP
jgi:hypothetical protein